MANEPITTVVGNLAGDVELKFLPSGIAVANFTVASTPRTFNRDTNAWDDGETFWLRCSIFREYAEHCAESLSRGMQVMVHGALKSRSWDKDGTKMTSIEMNVQDVGPTLRWSTASVTKTDRSNGGRVEHNNQGRTVATSQGTKPHPGGNRTKPGNDPWATGTPQDEPPF